MRSLKFPSAFRSIGMTVAITGVVFFTTGTNLVAQGHGGERGPSIFTGGATGAGASFHAGGPAVGPSAGGYATVSGYNGSSHYRVSPGSVYVHSGGTYRSHSTYPAPAYPPAYYAYPYYVTPSYGFVGDPSLLQGAAVPDQSVYNELDILHQQIDQLRADQDYLANGQPPPYGPPYANAEQPPAPKAPPALIVIFRDGTRAEVQDYAVVGDTFWDLSSHGTHKYPVAQLDLQASIKANDARGLEFPDVKQ